ncbi:MAG: GntR family transcriptional regulator [Candidatus Gastranaerophilaceae bacterium]
MKKTDEFLLLDKNNLRKLSVKDVSVPFPDLKNIFESKAMVVANWLIDWIEADFKAGKIKETDLLPQKADLAYHLGVSIGTMQNAFRYVEDKGHVESKQCIGTMVRNWKKSTSTLRKLTSKRDICVDLIKKYIIDKKIKIGQKLPSSRVLATSIGISPNTTRLALEALCSMRILEHKFKMSNEARWILASDNFSMPRTKLDISDNVTLVEKVEKDLEKYITKKLNVGDKLPAHERLSAELKVSIKTIHDALKSLIKKGILLARRGRYGTTVIKMPGENILSPKKETSIFASAQETAFYNYEKTQNHIKALIAQNYEIGSKLPSIMELSKELDLSPNTIRKALNNLANEGYLRFVRGRYGGTFVIDIPDTSPQSFKWLAVNPKYVEVYK